LINIVSYMKGEFYVISLLSKLQAQFLKMETRPSAAYRLVDL
jgi:hypothetical protein